MQSAFGSLGERPLRRRPLPPPAEDPYIRPPVETFAPVELAPDVKAQLRPVDYGGSKGALAGRVSTVKDWDKWGMAQRIAFLRRLAEDTSRDPAVARKATEILKEAGVPARDTKAQWAALLKWVQKNIYYVNEPNERLQSPQYTLTERHGDCDDMAILLFALGHSIRLPVRYVISGIARNGQKVRWIEGMGPVPPGVNWTHIYLQVGGPAFKPTWWVFAEPTLAVPLGWDVMAHKAGARLPEMSGALAGAPEVAAKAKDYAQRGAKAVNWGQVATLGVASVVTSTIGFYVTKHLLKKGKR